MNDEKITQTAQHNVIMENRKSLALSGVKDVDSFDEETVIALTNLGELTIRGENLHITNLSLDIGELNLEGEISSLTYSNAQIHTGGFFSRVFR